MKVILTNYHEKLGDVGDTVEVKSGYANNYLIPNGLAVPATKGNINQMKLVKQAAVKVEARNIKEAEELAKKLEDLQVTFIVKTGEEGKLYGSITNKDIAEKVSEERKIEIDRKKIDMQEHIKEIGEYEIELKLYKEVKSSVKVIVEPDEESKELIEAHKEEKEKAESLSEKEKQEVEEEKEKGERDKKKAESKESSKEVEKEDKKKTRIKSKDKDK
ncbi:MAG: 50S ribosomal protein L9 [Actinobacteria bacterium]|nr:50S ribosomal protein L9 [Actinomycetota bacterium]MCG2791263.1 50S ribosomal protein L9 [Actinomycetes bacterium]